MQQPLYVFFIAKTHEFIRRHKLTLHGPRYEKSLDCITLFFLLGQGLCIASNPFAMTSSQSVSREPVPRILIQIYIWFAPVTATERSGLFKNRPLTSLLPPAYDDEQTTLAAGPGSRSFTHSHSKQTQITWTADVFSSLRYYRARCTPFQKYIQQPHVHGDRSDPLTVKLNYIANVSVHWLPSFLFSSLIASADQRSFEQDNPVFNS